MKLAVLVLAPHPDDAELGCGGTIAKHIAKGLKVGIVDLTRGELSTRGTVSVRDVETTESSAILGLAVRENLNFKDGFFTNDKYHQEKIITVIRRYRPDIVLASAEYDRHPDHSKGARLAFEACFLSGLSKMVTSWDDREQAPWRPRAVYHYIQSLPARPDIIVDVSAYWDKKMQAVRAFASQFYSPRDTNGPKTYISDKNFMDMIEARGIEFGHAIGVRYGEGFTTSRSIGINLFTDLYSG